MPDDHSELVPLLPIPNRTVKRLSADDSAGSRVKVGHRQALTAQKTPVRNLTGVFCFLGAGRRIKSVLDIADAKCAHLCRAGRNQLRQDVPRQLIQFNRAEKA